MRATTRSPARLRTAASRRATPALAAALLSSWATAAGAAASSGGHAARAPFVDVHTHLDPAEPQRAVDAALQALAAENAAWIVLMPPPFAADTPGRFDAPLFQGAVDAAAGRLVVLGGGGVLNPMILDAARSGDAGPAVQRRFRERAQALLAQGVAGFGELAVEHFPGATPYESVPPDHPLLLLLADIAAEHRVPIVLHMEAVPDAMPAPATLASSRGPRELPANIDRFERLLAHNRGARIVWAHAGWDNAGYRDAALCRRLLLAHPNLYMDLKIDPLKPGLNPLLTGGADGPVRASWLALLRDYPDRFVIGTDQHYPEPPAGLQRWEAAVRLLDQLPADLQRKIGMENAQFLFGTRRAPGSGRHGQDAR